MIYTVHVFAPDPEGPATWLAGIQEIEGACAEGVSEQSAIAGAQAAALEHLADAIRTGARQPLDLYESVVFIQHQDDWSDGL